MQKENLKVELVFFNGCPSWKKAREVLSETLIELGVDADVELVQVETQEEVHANQFTGSPMIKVNGEDLFPTGQENYALGCRIYQTPEGYMGWPTKDMMLEQLNKDRGV